MGGITYDCPYCRAILPEAEAAELCPICGESLNFAMIVCSHQIGDIPAGMRWNLRPRNYSIGSGPDDDIRINAPGVNEGILKLIYTDGYFKVELSSRNKVNKKEHSYSFPVGSGMITLHYVTEIKLSEYKKDICPLSNILLSASCQILTMDDIQKIYEKALETVLRITCLEKAFYFSVGKNMEAVMEASKLFNNVEMDSRFCEFSETIIHRAVAVGDIVCLDLHKCGDASMSSTMAKLHLKQTICIPVMNSKGRLFGVIYADTQKSNLLAPKLGHFRPMLRILGKMVAMGIENSVKRGNEK